MKLPAFLLLVLLHVPAWSQFYFFTPLGQVKEFLQLSDAQVQTILSNNDEYNRWSSTRQSRIFQVQSEIAQETVKENLDPAALGIRYAEIELICRDMKDRANQYRTRNLSVLDPAQLAKIKVLEDALKLAPTISEAQSGNLVGAITSAPSSFISSSISSILGAAIGGANGCTLPFLVRAGDFSQILPTAKIDH